MMVLFFFFFQAEDGIRYLTVTGVQTCALPICWFYDDWTRDVYNWECTGCCAGRLKKLKVFRVTGEIKKPNLVTPFAKEVLASKPEHALEKVYAEIGSKHRVKRYYMKISAVDEISPEEIENPVLKK